MAEYQNFIGIDIGKFNFVAAVHNNKATTEYKNTADGIAEFINDNKDILPNTLTVIETTGGYELKLIYSLCQKNYAVHRADTRKIKSFIRSFGSDVKTDALDAKAIAYYGKERADTLKLFSPQSAQSIKLVQLVQRRLDLNKMLIAEKSRIKAPESKFIKRSCETMIRIINKQILAINQQIKTIIDSDAFMKAKQKILKSIPGIGEIISFELLALLPELGILSRRKLASLVGLAPKARDSGIFHGYRKTGHGRMGVKSFLFLAAMAARNSKSHLKEFYEKLIKKGKNKMVALTALMRKILVIANAKIKEFIYASALGESPSVKQLLAKDREVF